MVAERSKARSIWTAREAKQRFDDVLSLVEDGQTAAIARDGRIVAEVKPATSEEFTAEERQAAVARFLEERAKWQPTGVTREEILAWRHEGHRW